MPPRTARAAERSNSRELVIGIVGVEGHLHSRLLQARRTADAEVDGLRLAARRVDHGEAHADMPLGQLIGYLARFRSVVHHHAVVKFIGQAKYSHHVVGAVGMVVHDALAVENLHHGVQSQVVIRLLGRFVFGRNCLVIGIPFRLCIVAPSRRFREPELPLPCASWEPGRAFRIL